MNNFFTRKLTYRFFRRITRTTVAMISDEYPSTVEIEYAGLPSLNQANLKIYNLNKNIINSLTFLSFRNLNISDLCVECLNESKTIFIGDVVASTPIYDLPNPYLSVQAMTDIVYLVSPSKNIIYPIPPGRDYIEIPVIAIAKSIFSDTRKVITFNDIGIMRVSDPRYLGSKIQQLEKLKIDANINIIVNYDSVNLFSKYSGISKRVLDIDASSDKIVNHISNDKEGINFTILFNNNIELGSKIYVHNDTVNRQANGLFYVYDIKHSLSNKIPNGNFFTTLKARYLGG